MLIHVLVLNYNGRQLLAECLPSVLEAARASRHECAVAVIDNDSQDDSVPWLAEHFPGVEVIRRPNRALVSFNDVLAGLPGPVAILLNNDVKLDPDAIDPLVEPLLRSHRPQPVGLDSPLAPHLSPLAPRPFMTAPRCVRFDGTTYEGLKAAVRWRFGLVEATVFYPGHEPVTGEPDWTAAAGSVLAVDRKIFVALGGFDPLYLPGRLEDVDFAYRGYLAGYHACYVPEALAYHQGMATFGAVYGTSGCDALALRNTLLFQWKNLRHPRHLARQLAGAAARIAWDVLRSPWTPKPQRFPFVRALAQAVARVRAMRSGGTAGLPSNASRRDTKLGERLRRERDYFRRFHPRQMARPAVDRRLEATV